MSGHTEGGSGGGPSKGSWLVVIALNILSLKFDLLAAERQALWDI